MKTRQFLATVSVTTLLFSGAASANGINDVFGGMGDMGWSLGSGLGQTVKGVGHIGFGIAAVPVDIAAFCWNNPGTAAVTAVSLYFGWEPVKTFATGAAASSVLSSATSEVVASESVGALSSAAATTTGTSLLARSATFAGGTSLLLGNDSYSVRYVYQGTHEIVEGLNTAVVGTVKGALRTAWGVVQLPWDYAKSLYNNPVQTVIGTAVVLGGAWYFFPAQTIATFGFVKALPALAKTQGPALLTSAQTFVTQTGPGLFKAGLTHVHAFATQTLPAWKATALATAREMTTPEKLAGYKATAYAWLPNAVKAWLPATVSTWLTGAAAKSE